MAIPGVGAAEKYQYITIAGIEADYAALFPDP